jgi:hypothetical protein
VTAFPAAPLDRPTRIVTVGLALALLLVLPLLLSAPSGEPAIALALGLAGGLLVAGAWAAGPSRYELDGRTLRVHRRALGSTAFTLTGTVRRAPAELGLGMRSITTGGLFGWVGAFRHPLAGRYRAYMTDRGRLVACETGDGLVVVSPADPEAFLRTARRAVQGGPG